MNDANDIAAALAVIEFRRFMDVKMQMQRLSMSVHGTPAADWLIERGYLAAKAMPSTRQFRASGDEALYVTAAGKAWYASTGGVHAALTVLARAGRALAA